MEYDFNDFKGRNGSVGKDKSSSFIIAGLTFLITFCFGAYVIMSLMDVAIIIK